MMKNGFKIGVALSILLGVSAVNAEETVLKELREKQAEKGIEVGLGATTVYQHNVKNGTSTNSNRGDFSGSYDIEINLSLPELLGLEGNVFIHGEGGWPSSDGTDGSSVGGISPVNADFIGSRSLDVVEVFYETDLMDNLGLTIGKIDFTGFFDAGNYANDEASQFLNGALVNNPSIPFPDYSLGFILSAGLSDNLSVMAGVADAEADGRETGFRTTFDGEDYFFYIAEMAFVPEGELASQYTVGLWYDPQPKASSGSDVENTDDVGFYFNIDHELFTEAGTEDQGLGAFFRYGFANEDKNDISGFYSCGLQYVGLVAGRDVDVCGLGYASACMSGEAEDEFPSDYEGIIEAYYNCEVCPAFHVSPDIQYVTNPGAADVNSALVMGVRAQVEF